MKKHFFFLISLTAILFASCESLFNGIVVDVEIPPHQSQLAPYAFFKDTDTVLHVAVGKSVGILDNTDPSVVQNATVELYKNGSLVHTFYYVDSSNTYQAPLTGIFDANPNSNDLYELKVVAPGYEAVSAQQTMPSPVPITEVEYLPEGGVDRFGDVVDIFNITFNDPPAVKNFYEVAVIGSFRYQDPFDTTIVYEYSTQIYLATQDPIVQAGATFSDATFDGGVYKIRFESFPQWGGEQPTFTVYLRSLSEEMYNYNISLNTYFDTDGTPFAEPTILYSNMSKNLGMFGLFSTSFKVVD